MARHQCPVNADTFAHGTIAVYYPGELKSTPHCQAKPSDVLDCRVEGVHQMTSVKNEFTGDMLLKRTRKQSPRKSLQQMTTLTEQRRD